VTGLIPASSRQPPSIQDFPGGNGDVPLSVVEGPIFKASGGPGAGDPNTMVIFTGGLLRALAVLFVLLDHS